MAACTVGQSIDSSAVTTATGAITDNRPANFGNTVGNLGNLGQAVQDGEYFYYSTSNTLYKADFGLQNMQTILKGSAIGNLNIVDGWIYYTQFDSNNSQVSGIWKVDVNGQSNQKISNINPYEMAVVGDKLYTSVPLDGILYSMNLDGSGVTKMANIGAGSTMYIENDVIYYEGDTGINKINMDGAGQTLVVPSGGGSNFIVYNGYIYSCDYSGPIYKTEINEGTPEKIADGWWGGFNICGNTLYYSARLSDAFPDVVGIHAQNLDTGKDRIIAPNFLPSEIYIINNKIFFPKNFTDTDTFYLMNLDGSGLGQGTAT